MTRRVAEVSAEVRREFRQALPATTPAASQRAHGSRRSNRRLLCRNDENRPDSCETRGRRSLFSGRARGGEFELDLYLVGDGFKIGPHAVADFEIQTL